MAPFLQDEIGWSEKQYGNINTAFMIGYAICFLIMGAFVDKIGTKTGYAISVGLWAIAQASTALAKSWIGFAFARSDFRLVSQAISLLQIKCLPSGFPKRSGHLLSVSITEAQMSEHCLSPLIIPVVVSAFGNDWRAAFLWTIP